MTKNFTKTLNSGKCNMFVADTLEKITGLKHARRLGDGKEILTMTMHDEKHSNFVCICKSPYRYQLSEVERKIRILEHNLDLPWDWEKEFRKNCASKIRHINSSELLNCYKDESRPNEIQGGARFWNKHASAPQPRPPFLKCTI